MKGFNKMTERIVAGFSQAPGVKAIVLGGSQATGTATALSDVDIALYYDQEIGLDWKQMNEIAQQLDDRHTWGLMVKTGEWGPWINGGGWLLIDGVAVDVLFRDFQQVEQEVDHCLNGEITLDYQCGHPFAFVNSIYLGEVFYCRILWERDQDLQRLKERLAVYPETYRQSVFQKFLWEAQFSLDCGRKSGKKQDLVYGIGSLYRAVNAMVQVLYALNQAYLLNEKGSIRRLHKLERSMPPGWLEQLESVLEGVTLENMDSRFEQAEQCLRQLEEAVSMKEYGERSWIR
ncbi:MAG: nucleotidyltransferase domain-containing protein [Massiliimalia sp.]|jgi:predicted nucleotidyltransferase